MNPNKIFTRQLMGLDYRVWRVLLILVIVCLALVSYRLIDLKKCTPVNFLIKTIAVHTDSVYGIGESLSFIASTSQDEITWDFGDNSDKVTGQYVTHAFSSEGSYKVSASTGTSCQTIKQITVKKAVVVKPKDDGSFAGEEIVGPVSTMEGNEEIFTFMVTADFYEWSIANFPKMTRTGSSAKFQFPGAGKYTVQVTLDHDRTKRYTKEVTVEARPNEKSPIPDNIKPLLPDDVKPLPDPNKNVKISDAIFMSYLQKVVDKKMAARDFDNYLCYKGETKVVSNGELMSFNAFCDEISGKTRRKFLGRTKIKIQSAEMRRDTEGCVNIIEVKYK